MIIELAISVLSSSTAQYTKMFNSRKFDSRKFCGKLNVARKKSLADLPLDKTNRVFYLTSTLYEVCVVYPLVEQMIAVLWRILSQVESTPLGDLLFCVI